MTVARLKQRISPTEDIASVMRAPLDRYQLDRSDMLPVSESDRPDISDYQSNAALSLAKPLKQNPRKLADEIVASLQTDMFASVSVDGPGFINFRLSPQYLSRLCNALAEDPRLGCAIIGAPCRVVIDYGGPNVAKSMHVGHLRSTIIGFALKQIFEFFGYEVLGDVHLGDWGTQMGMLIHELRTRQPELVYFDAGFTGSYPASPPISLHDLETMYPQAAERCQRNPADMEVARLATLELQSGRAGFRALWTHFVSLSTASLVDDFDFLGVKFDLWWGESRVDALANSMVDALQSQGMAVESDGALVVPVSEATDKHEIPPLILRKSDGAMMYGTTDLATISARIDELKADLVLYVVDQRQSLHFEQVFRASVKAGFCRRDQLEHIGFGTVNGADGRPFKTRAGGVMKLRELLDAAETKALERIRNSELSKQAAHDADSDIPRKLANAAVKFADLGNFRLSSYSFDLERFVSFEGRTGPYILYTIVRIRSILERPELAAIARREILDFRSPAERELQLLLTRFPESLARSLELRAPNILCDYIFGLAQAFSRFYAAHHILSEPDASVQSSWLSLIRLTLRILENSVRLLGIEPAQRM